MAKVVIINGYPGSGKDTFVRLCEDLYLNTYNLHSSDPAKQALGYLGWDGEKTPEARKILADLTAFSYNCTHNPIAVAIRAANAALDHGLLFIHVREWDNVLRFKKDFPSATTLFIDRFESRQYKETGNNPSDREADTNKEQYDYTVYNNGTIQQLAQAAEMFLLTLSMLPKRRINP